MFIQNEEIIYSGLVLRELKTKLSDLEFENKKNWFEQEEKFKFEKVTESDYKFARELESKLKYELSFYDCLHLAICKRLNLVLVTRDYLLIKFAKGIIRVDKPEKLKFMGY